MPVYDSASFQRHYRAMVKLLVRADDLTKMWYAIDERAILTCMAKVEGAPYDRALLELITTARTRSEMYYAAEDALFRGLATRLPLRVIHAFVDNDDFALSDRAREALERWAGRML